LDVGMQVALRLTLGMGAKDFTELVAWQLADEVKDWVCRLLERPAGARNRPFCLDADDAAASAPRNIAEGFGRFNGKEFAHFLKIAIASEMETRNNILDACKRGCITAEERDNAVGLSRRAVTAAARLRKYLLSSRNPWKQAGNRGCVSAPRKRPREPTID
jgi:four helix bundle protein